MVPRILLETVSCDSLRRPAVIGWTPQNQREVGKMWNCGMWKVKCEIPKCGNVCGMVGKMRNAENLTAVALYAYNGLKNAVSIDLRNGI